MKSSLSLALALLAGAVFSAECPSPGTLSVSVDGAAAVTVDELIARARKPPCLAVTPARVAALKARLETDKALQDWWNGLRKYLERVLSRPVDVPDRGGQWCHYFNCRKCAAALKSEGPTRHVCTNPNCREVHSGWPYDDVYVMGVHNGLASDIQSFGLAYQLTGDRRYADRAKETLLAYARVYPSYEPHTIKGRSNSVSGGKIGPQTLEEAQWLVKICLGYDMVAETLSDDEKATVRRDLLLPSAKVVARHDKQIGNWQCWHLSAFGLAGLVCGDAELVARAVAGKYGYLEQLRQGVFDDGIWNECAWGYHFYTLRGLSYIVAALDNLGVRPPARMKLMFDSAFGQVMPDWTFSAANDSGRHAFRTWASMYEMAWTWWKDPVYAWWLARNGRRNPDNAYYGSDLPKILPKNLTLGSKLYANGGIAVMRSNPPGASGLMPVNFLSVDFGPSGGWHGHPDKLHLELFSRGETLAEDPGMVGYGNARQWGWYRTSLAHNTLVMDGHNQAEATGSCEAFATAGNATVGSFGAGEAYGAAKVGRVVALVGDVVLDYTWVKGDCPHDWEWAFHSRGTLTVPLALKPVAMPPLKRLDAGKNTAGMDIDNNGVEAWGWTRDTAEGPHDGLWRAKWTTPKATLNLVQKAPPGTIRTGTGSAQPSSKELTLAVNRVGRRQDAVFATVMTLDGTEDAAIDAVIADPDGTEGFSATVGGRRFLILRSPKGDCRGRKARAVVVEFEADGRPALEVKAF